MTLQSRYIVYPEGDMQDAPVQLRINQIVDLNGYPLAAPIPTVRTIAYRVFRISRKESRAEESTYYWLELVRPAELLELLS